MKIINLTGHDVVLKAGSRRVVYAAAKNPIRVDLTTYYLRDLDGFPLNGTHMDDIGMPTPMPGTVYIVSSLARHYLKVQGRTDIVSPDVSTAKRNYDDSVMHVRAFKY